MPDSFCQTCRYMWDTEDLDYPGRRYRCRRFPPVAWAGEMDEHRWFSPPITQLDNVCGEWTIATPLPPV